MTVMVSVEFKFNPEAAEAAIEGLKSALPETRAFKGCIDVKSYYEPETSSLVLIELWDSAADQQAYIGWRAETGSLDGMADILVAPPIFRTFDVRADI